MRPYNIKTKNSGKDQTRQQNNKPTVLQNFCTQKSQTNISKQHPVIKLHIPGKQR